MKAEAYSYIASDVTSKSKTGIKGEGSQKPKYNKISWIASLPLAMTLFTHPLPPPLIYGGGKVFFL